MSNMKRKYKHVQMYIQNTQSTTQQMTSLVTSCHIRHTDIIELFIL